MFDEQDNVIRYKWDPWTGSGYRIRRAVGGGEHHFFVEDWSNHVVVDDYGCDNLDEALGVLRRYCAGAADDVLLLVIAPRLDWKTLTSKWAQAVDAAGVIVQVRQLQGQRLSRWLAGRLERAGFRPDADALAVLAERVEGNRLAAAQEIEKLKLLREPGPLDAQALLASVADNARYDLFDLTDAALAGDRARADRVLRVPYDADSDMAVNRAWFGRPDVPTHATSGGHILFYTDGDSWVARALAVAALASVLAAIALLAITGCWALLARCADADLAIKGRGDAEPWTVLAEIADGLALAARGKG